MSMAPSSLVNMPSELLISVFKHAPNLSTASAISQSSMTIHAIWTANIPVICDSILPRTIECHEQAKELFEAQEKVAPVEQALESRLKAVSKSKRRDFPEIKYLKRAPKKTKLAIEKVRRMLSNAKMMESVLDRLNISETTNILKGNFQPEPRRLSAAERERFIKAYYGATCLATLAEAPGLRTRLAHLDRFEVFQISDVLIFLSAKKNPRPMLKVSKYPTDDEPHNPGERSNRNWSKAGSMLRWVRCQLLTLPMNKQFISCDGLRPRYQFLQDGEWEQAKEGRGPPLVDLLTME